MSRSRQSRSALLLPLLLPLLLLLLAVNANVVNGLGYCEKVQTSGQQPPSLPNSFQTKIEMKNTVSNQTTDIDLWSDFNRNLSRLHIEQDSQEFDLYYSFSTQEIYYVQTRSLQCMVFNMSTGGDLDIMIGRNISGVILPDDAKTLFRLNPEFGIKFMPGKYTVRGIRANRWYSCQSWPERRAEFAVNWYFSDPSWATVSPVAVPLRIEVEGWSNSSLDPNRHFRQVYDFVFFRQNLRDSERVFQTPLGAFCSKRSHTKQIPKLSPILIFTSEKTIGSTDQIRSVQYGRMQYDSTQNIVSYEYREPGSLEKPPFYNIGSLTVVQDFNSGVVYFIDNVLGNCTSKPIGTELLDVDDVGSAGWHLVALKSPMELLVLDDRYQYEGTAMVRGLPVDVFISMRQISVHGSPTNVTFEYYILQDSVTEIVLGPGKIGFGHSVPVELRIVSYTELGPDVDPTFSYFERHHFFNFDSAMADPSEGIDTDQVQAYNFDIGQCYTDEHRLNFMLKLKPEDASLPVSAAMNQTHSFIRRAIKTMSDTDMGLVNEIRYQHPRLDFDDNYLYLLVTLLDKPDIYSLFAAVAKPNQRVLSVLTSAKAATEAECLEFCYNSVAEGCRSAAFCHGTNVPEKNCLVSAEYGFQDNTEGYICNAFFRPTNISSLVSELDLNSAWSYIQLSATTATIRIPISLPDGVRGFYVGVSAEIVDVRFDVYNPLTGRHLKQFNRLEKSAMKSWKRKLEGRVSADECAIACLNEGEFDCKSVTYCYDLGFCYVSDKAATDVPDTDILARARCDVFSVNPLSKYTEYPGTSKVRLTGKLPAGNGTSAVACANLCTAAGSGNESNACRSFDACKMQQQQPLILCYLSSGHSTDTGSGIAINASECSHFSKSFLADFAQDSIIRDPKIDHMLVKDSITVDQCARVCAEELDSDCQGFYYCSDRMCAIRGVDVSPAQMGGGGGDVECQYWRRAFSQDGSLYQPHKPQTGSPSHKGVDVGAAVAIYIVCSLIGAVLGPVVLIAVMHAMGKSIWRDLKALVTWR